MCEPVIDAPQQKRSRLPWIVFGLLVIWAASFGFYIPEHGPGLITQVTTKLAAEWRDTVAQTAQTLPKLSGG